MPDISDMDLVREYAASHSESAFAELVQRHINLAYSVALRFTGNSPDAEDVTQAVFIILAKKAASLRAGTIFTGWIYETTRLAAMQFLRNRTRRHRHEQEAHMQSTVENSNADEVWAQLAPLLEEAMSRLNENERTLLALRYFENKNGSETAALLGIQEWAAHKRTARALEKLRRYFSRRGVDSTTTVIAGAISANSIQVAPLTLAKSVTAAALAKTATASSTLILAKATLIAMKTKTLVTAITVAVAIVGVGGYLVYQSRATRPSPASRDTAPIKLANDSFKDLAGVTGDPLTNKFISELDPDTRRTTNSAPSRHIKCLVEPTSTGSADFLKSLTNFVAKGLANSSFVGYRVDKNSSLFGKRVRISGWMKTGDVRNWAGVSMSVIHDGHIFASDTMYDRPLHGTTDWQPVEIVTDVPEEPCTIIVLPTLYGTGETGSTIFKLI
jgi:RNA polymerase sigma factor (sigma-70 family)